MVTGRSGGGRCGLGREGQVQGLRTLGNTQQLHGLLGFPSGGRNVGHPNFSSSPPGPPVAREPLRIPGGPFKEKQKGFVSKGSFLP